MSIISRMNNISKHYFHNVPTPTFCKLYITMVTADIICPPGGRLAHYQGTSCLISHKALVGCEGRHFRLLVPLATAMWQPIYRDDSRFAHSQWETALLWNDVSHWLCASLKLALYIFDLFSRCQHRHKVYHKWKRLLLRKLLWTSIRFKWHNLCLFEEIIVDSLPRKCCCNIELVLLISVISIMDISCHIT